MTFEIINPDKGYLTFLVRTPTGKLKATTIFDVSEDILEFEEHLIDWKVTQGEENETAPQLIAVLTPSKTFTSAQMIDSIFEQAKEVEQ